MKTRTLVTLATIAGGLYLLNELRKKTETAAASMVKSPVSGLADDILGPSPQNGQWITKGDLRGILPREYHDFTPGMDGFGRRLRSAVSHVTAPVRKVIQRVEAPVMKVAKIAAAPVIAAQVAVAKLAVRKLIPGKKVSAAPAAPGEVIQYQDVDGRPITKEEFDRLNAQAAAQQQSNVTPYNSTQIIAQPSSTLTPEQLYRGSAASSNDTGTVLSTSSSDYDYGSSNSDSSVPSTSSVSASSTGSPGLPVSVSSVQTPSADTAAPAADTAAPAADTAAPAPKSPLVPALVGGGILAAILAFGK